MPPFSGALPGRGCLPHALHGEPRCVLLLMDIAVVVVAMVVVHVAYLQKQTRIVRAASLSKVSWT